MPSPKAQHCQFQQVRAPSSTDQGESARHDLIERHEAVVEGHASDGVRGARDCTPKHPPTNETAPLRSIFPIYNPNLPLSQQDYVPTQRSPTHIPRAVISRQSVYDEPDSPAATATNPGESYRQSPRQVQRGQWPPRIQTQSPSTVPASCTAADLKSLWKVADGGQASPSDHGVYCLKLAQQKKAPVYTLSSGTADPFWRLHLDPTSASAYVSLARHNPSKPSRAPRADSTSSPTSRRLDTKHWHEALTTTIHEGPQRHAPNDGLVALLVPTAVTKTATRHTTSLIGADNECARLVWDRDTQSYFLVHNALEKPFCVTIERNPAYSRTTYTLEHSESSKHLVKLVRDGTAGGGWIELDTGVAAQIDSRHILDVSVAALLLVVAVEDRKATPMETFEPPPAAVVSGGKTRDSGRLSTLSARLGDRHRSKKIAELDVDVESQSDSLAKGRQRTEEPGEKLPLVVRVVVRLAKGCFVIVIWGLTVVCKCVGGVLKVLYRCVGSKY